MTSMSLTAFSRTIFWNKDKNLFTQKARKEFLSTIQKVFITISMENSSSFKVSNSKKNGTGLWNNGMINQIKNSRIVILWVGVLIFHKWINLLMKNFWIRIETLVLFTQLVSFSLKKLRQKHAWHFLRIKTILSTVKSKVTLTDFATLILFHSKF